MTISPVTLDEFKEFINDTASVGKDAEMWGKVLAATRQVENVVGAIEVRAVTETVQRLTRYYGWPYDTITTSQWPVLLQPTFEDVTPDDAVGYVYLIAYTVGREPVPEDLRELVLIRAEQLWQAHRGPMTQGRPSADPDQGGRMAARRYRADEIQSAYCFSPVVA